MEPFAALLVCTDPGSLAITQKILEEYGITVKLAATSSAAQELIKTHKFDLAVYDTDVPGALELCPQRPVFNAPKMVFAMARKANLSALHGRRVHFVVQKPFTGGLFARSLRASYGTMIRERRASFRHSVKINPVSGVLLQEAGNQNLRQSIILDLSQNGMCIQTQEVLPQGATLQVDFELPDSREVVHVTGSVMWTRASGRTGLRFVQVPAQEQKALIAWLDSILPFDAEIIPRLVPSLRHDRAYSNTSSDNG